MTISGSSTFGLYERPAPEMVKPALAKRAKVGSWREPEGRPTLRMRWEVSMMGKGAVFRRDRGAARGKKQRIFGLGSGGRLFLKKFVDVPAALMGDWERQFASHGCSSFLRTSSRFCIPRR